MFFVVTCLYIVTTHVIVCVCHAELKRLLGYLLYSHEISTRYNMHCAPFNHIIKCM